MNVILTSNQWGEGAQLLGQGQQDFILVVDGVSQKWDQFGTSAFDSQGQGDGRQLFDGIQAELKRNKNGYKSGEFKMTHQATANRFSLFSRLAPVVSRILR